MARRTSAHFELVLVIPRRFIVYAGPLGMREQLSFSDEPIGGVALPLSREFKSITYLKDEGGTESYQLFAFNLDTQQETRLSSGSGRYTGLAYSPSGSVHQLYLD